MRKRLFLALTLLGFALGIGVACVESSFFAKEPPADAPAVAVVQSAEVEEPMAAPPAPLPPETAAIVEQAGSGLFDPPRGDVRFVVISDLNGPYGSTDYDPEVDLGLNLVPFWQPDMVLCSGDMVAGQDLTLSTERIRAMWAAFDDHIAASLRRMNMPFGFTIGNHDASGAQGISGGFLFQQERDLASEYWNQPAHDPNLQFVDRYEFPFYYSFEYQDIFFVAWDGSASIIPPEKLAWVEQALASDKAQQAKMRIMVGHLPLYAVAVGRNEPAEVMNNAEELQAMMERYNVHTYISGHHHAYYPAHRGNLQFLHTGILGSGPRPLIDSNLPPRKTLTVVDVNFNSPEVTTYNTFDMQQLVSIENEELPRFLLGHNGRLLRRDVQSQDLTAAEQSQCEQQLGAAKCAA
jgi:hypothetical protein